MNRFKTGDKVRIHGHRSNAVARNGRTGTVLMNGTTDSEVNAVCGPIYAVELDGTIVENGVRSAYVFTFEKHLQLNNHDQLRRELREAEEKVAAVRRQLGDD